MIRAMSFIAFALLTSSCVSIQSDSTAQKNDLLIKESSVITSAANGLITLQSDYSVKETADRFESIIKDKGLTLFTRIDHQKNAQGVELELRPTEVIIFGNPKAGTPLMQCAQSVAIDLPQKVLISEDEKGIVHLTYNDPKYLKNRHSIVGCDKVINNISMLLNNLSTAATLR